MHDSNQEDNTSEIASDSQERVDESLTISLSKKGLKKAGLTVLGLLGIGVFVTVALLSASFLAPTKLSSAVEACKLKGNSNVSLDTNGKSLFINGQGSEGSGLGIGNLNCLISELALPQSIIDRMNNTTALMGSQEAEFSGMKMQWTYHPSNGLDMSFTY